MGPRMTLRPCRTIKTREGRLRPAVFGRFSPLGCHLVRATGCIAGQRRRLPPSLTYRAAHVITRNAPSRLTVTDRSGALICRHSAPAPRNVVLVHGVTRATPRSTTMTDWRGAPTRRSSVPTSSTDAPAARRVPPPDCLRGTVLVHRALHPSRALRSGTPRWMRRLHPSGGARCPATTSWATGRTRPRGPVTRRPQRWRLFRNGTL
jgi:hypothetical protein